jgi:hypothetical protein
MAEQIVDQEMETRELPKFIQFTAGDFVEGIIVGIESALIKGKNCTRYTVMQNDDQLVSFIGTNQLDRKLRVNDRGHRISIRCTGEDPNVQKGDNKMKLFDVKVGKSLVKGAPLLAVQNQVNPEITDDDIPF